MDLTYQEGNIVTADGAQGTFKQLPLQPGQTEPLVEVAIKDKPPVMVPVSLLRHKRGKTFTLSLRLDELAHAVNIAAIIPLVAEEAFISKQTVVTGGVRVSKKVYRDTKTIDEPLLKEDVEISRTPINRFVDAPAPIREEGDATIVPLYEEALVVEKRLFLREELVIRKRRTEFHSPQTITRRREDVVIEELDGQGNLKLDKKAKTQGSTKPLSRTATAKS